MKTKRIMIAILTTMCTIGLSAQSSFSVRVSSHDDGRKPDVEAEATVNQRRPTPRPQPCEQDSPRRHGRKHEHDHGHDHEEHGRRHACGHGRH